MRDGDDGTGQGGWSAGRPQDPVLPRTLADLFGRLLLREANAADLEQLHRGELRGALESLGLSVPPGATERLLAELSRQYRSTFPDDGAEPLVASHWRQAHGADDTADVARRVALAVGARLDPTTAPVDHLGHLLCLWARADEALPQEAARLRREHLAWGIDALQDRALGTEAGFYPSLARATIALLVELTSPADV